MLPILQIGPLALQTPGLILLVALWIGLNLSEKVAEKYQAQANLIYNLFFYSLLAGIAGARLTYLLMYPEMFANSPLSIFGLTPVTLDLSGGLLAGFLTGLIYGQRKNMAFWSTMDALTPLFSVFAVGIGLANFASGNAYGIPTRAAWGINLWGEIRHPTQIYQVILSSIIAWCIFPGKNTILRFNWIPFKPGMTFLLFLSMFLTSQIFLETFRGDRDYPNHGIRLIQIAYWIILFVSLIILERKQNHGELR